MRRFLDCFKENFHGRVRMNETMSQHTTFRIGGPADVFITVEDEDSLLRVIKTVKELDIPLNIIGNGSNLIVREHGIRGVVVKLTGEFKNYEIKGTKVKVGSGMSLISLAKKTATIGLAGIEMLAGVPGTVGGALVMNAGAYGQSIGDVVRSVRIIDRDGNIYNLKPDELQFAYRTSSLQERDCFVVSAELELSLGNPEELTSSIKEISSKRETNQPSMLTPNAGSIFRNPPNMSAGKLIDDLGLKGLNKGRAMVSDIHANFIVNMGGATADDVLELISDIQDKVKEKYDVELKTEVKIIGE